MTKANNDTPVAPDTKLAVDEANKRADEATAAKDAAEKAAAEASKRADAAEAELAKAKQATPEKVVRGEETPDWMKPGYTGPMSGDQMLARQKHGIPNVATKAK